MQVGCGYSGGGEMFVGAQRINGGFGRLYVGSPYQRGHGGIGSFLAGIFRRILPLLIRGVKADGKEAVRAGMNIMLMLPRETHHSKSRFDNVLKNLAKFSNEKQRRNWIN